MSGPTPSLQYAWDGPGALGAGQDAQYLRWNNTTGRFEMASAGVSDHGGLSGLSDDDHAQYALLAGRSGGQTLVGDTASGGGLTLTSTSHATKGIINASGATRLDLAADAELRFAASGYGLRRSGSSMYLDAGGTDVFRLLSTGPVVQSGKAITVVAGNSIFSPATAAGVPLTLKGAASQTANLQEWQNSAGTVLSSVDAAGRFLAPAGAAAAPALAFAGDTNTGIYAVASDRVGIATGGTLRFDISATNFAYVNTSGQNVFQVTPLGVVSSGITGQGITVSPVGASTIPLTVKGAASQSANLQEWQDSTGGLVARVGPGGVIGVAGASVSAPAVTFLGDSNNGLYYIGADNWALSAGGGSVLALNAATPNVLVTAQGAAHVPLTVKGAASQTANLQEWQNSAGTVVAYVAASGQIVASNGLSCATFTNSGSIQAGSGGSFLKAADGANKIGWNATGIGFFNVTPVARPTALTAADAGALNTGDATSDTVIGNMRTRINELESKLQALGLLT